MGRSKDLFMEMIQKMRASWFTVEDMMSDLSELGTMEKLDMEEVTFKKGNFNTKVVLFFQKDGQCIHTKMTSEYVPSEREVKENDLKVELKRALELDTPEGYTRAAEIKKQMEQLGLKTN
jgi:hypothetical protein